MANKTKKQKEAQWCAFLYKFQAAGWFLELLNVVFFNAANLLPLFIPMAVGFVISLYAFHKNKSFKGCAFLISPAFYHPLVFSLLFIGLAFMTGSILTLIIPIFICLLCAQKYKDISQL